MWRDRWFTVGVVGAVLGVIGAALACVACLTPPLAIVALGAIGLGAWVERLDAVLLAVVVVLTVLAVYRYRKACRRKVQLGRDSEV